MQVFDQIEELDIEPNVFPFLMKLHEIQPQIQIIFISFLKWNLLQKYFLYPQPLTVNFQKYSRDETIQILMLDGKDFMKYEQFVGLVIDSISSVTTNLNELRYLCSVLYPKYIEPIKEGKATADQSSKLFTLFQRHLQVAFNNLFLRTMNDKKIELPYYTKFLLIASFLGSFNPSRLDNRFFTKGGEKKIIKHKSKRQQLLGPKAFDIERLLAIFYSILDQEIPGCFDISTLVNLRLLIKVNNHLNYKIKCNVGYEFILIVSKSVSFDISKYLYDFTEI
ncbi:Origin recognition complex subunit 5 [Boothiomyces macroporosus]|uniref:Origin recognition complex subunit 5 n=1 Tax=Boothiomyces macroporosus TaxID=261099 RepID=A0AAD5UMK5_9FUNG|nr:Origin recognition complex subunit 5 [Boothiomyces macroporosus]